MSYIKNLKKQDDKLLFSIDNESNNILISLINSIRRIINSDIETYIIDEKSIEFFSNSSILNNEFLKHRLILIPIISDLKLDYEKIIIKCNKKNNDESIKNICVKDFECFIDDKKIDNNKLFKYEEILFAKLKFDQEIIFECKLTKNNAENGGSFFCPVSTCIYTFEIDKNESNKIMKNMTNDEKNNYKTQDVERNYLRNKDNNPLIYNFVIESIGFYNSENILMMGINLLREKLTLVNSEFKNRNSSKVQFIEDNENDNFFNFIIDKENDTIGNLLSTYLINDENVFYCGYEIEHPLNYNIKLKIKLKENNEYEKIIEVIDKKIDYIIKILNQMLNDIF